MRATNPFLAFPALSMIMFYKWVKLLLHRIDKKFYWEEIKSVLSDLIHRKLKGESLFFFQIISFSLSLLQVRLLQPSFLILIPMPLLPLIHPPLCLKPRPKMIKSSFFHLNLRRKLLNCRPLLRMMIFCMTIFHCMSMMSMMRLPMQVGI